MTTRLCFRAIFNPVTLKIKPIASVLSRKLHTNEVPVKEVEIPVRWGHLAAKYWGKEDGRRPILALHGWQDNAGTWDPLAPMIAKDRPILAIDFPGHGFSSWIPAGLQYYPWELPRLVLYLMEYFKWDKVSLLCHSMGSIAGLRFASLCPEHVDFYIAVDSLVQDDYSLESVVENYPKVLRKIQIDQARLNTEPPSYTKEQLANIWHLGTKKSVALESVHHLMTRGIKASSTDPNKFYFSRDSRLKHILFNPEDKKFVEALAKRLQSPTLYVKGKNSPYATDPFSVEMRELIEKNNSKFECHFLEGTHHLHLNTPELLWPLIDNFFKKHNL